MRRAMPAHFGWYAAALAVLLGCAAAAAPVIEWRAGVRAEIAALEAERARLEASLHRIADQRAALGTVLGEGLVWHAPDASEATAQVQAALSRMAAESGVALRTVTPAGARDIPLAEVVMLRLEGEGSLPAWTAFLLASEHAHAPLVVERASLRRLARSGAEGADVFVAAQIDFLAPFLPEAEG